MTNTTITLRDILSLLEDNDYSLSEDASIQILDLFTGARFRRDKGIITLGGDFYCHSFMELLNLTVGAMEDIHSTLNFYVYAT